MSAAVGLVAVVGWEFVQEEAGAFGGVGGLAGDFGGVFQTGGVLDGEAVVVEGVGGTKR